MTAEKWDIDNSHSSVGFTVRHLVFSKVHGQFTKWTGQLALDTADLAASKVSVQIDVGSIDTREAQRDGHLRSADFFDVEKFPAMTFTSKRVEKKGATTLKLVGDLTIRDVTKEIALDVELAGRGKDPWGAERIGFTASGKLNRSDYGLKWNQALETGGVLVGETVELVFEIQAKRVEIAPAKQAQPSP